MNQQTIRKIINVDITKTITHLSLCSGYEGIGLGLRRVLPNLREIAYVEREGFPVANLVAKMEAGELDAAPVFTDVKTFPYRKFRGCVDILSGGFPCQPFSAAGKRQATEDPRHLFPYIADGIRECQPRICFLENVAGIISAKTGDGESVLQYVLRELEGLGYRATAGIFSAEEVGAPHQRKRVFILGMANSEDIGRGGRTYRNGDDRRGLQEQEAQEQSNLWGEAAGCGRDSRGELGNAKHMRESQPQGSEQDKRGWTQHSSEELGNTADLRLQQPSADSRETSSDQSREERGVYEPQRASSLSRHGSQSQGSQELANSNHEGLEGYQRHSSSEQGEPIQEDTWAAGGTRWPARPGEPQHEWEEPRVVADSSMPGSSRQQQHGNEWPNKEEAARSGSCDKRQAEPQLGRTPNGSSGRVDRLRLLGNGVVPATAAKAFITLINRLV